MNPAERRPNLPSLTGLRWVAAMMVFTLHMRLYFTGTPGWYVDWAFRGGSSGVSFFFILSGFVLVWSARDHDSAFTFWRRRFARIYPLHLVTALMALGLAYTLAPAMRPHGTHALVANLLLISTWWHKWWQVMNPVSWSLAVEAFFYACFPFLHFFLRRMSPWMLWVTGAAALVATPLASRWSDVHHLGWSLNTYPPLRLPEFVLGAVIARLVLLGAWRGPRIDVAVALSAAGYFLIARLPNTLNIASATLLGFATLIAAAAVADIEKTTSTWRHPVLVRLGEWSFAFYMVHVLVMRAFQHWLGAKPKLPVEQSVLTVAAIFAISLALSAALYHFVEVPGRRLLLRSWRRRPATTRGPAPTAQPLPDAAPTAQPLPDAAPTGQARPLAPAAQSVSNDPSASS
ncbi:MAG: acyltransferase family protein [Kineosporiaceae bacterium]